MQPENLNAMMKIRSQMSQLYHLRDSEKEDTLISGNQSLDSIKIVPSSSKRLANSVYMPSENENQMVSKNLNDQMLLYDIQPPLNDDLDSKPQISRSSKSKKKKKSFKSSADYRVGQNASFENNHSTLSNNLRSTLRQADDISDNLHLYRSRSTQHLPSEPKQVKQVTFKIPS